TPRPPRRPSAMAVAGLIVASEGWATQGILNGYASSCQFVETSSTSRVRRVGTIAMSSRWYPRRALLLSPISTTSRIVSSCWKGWWLPRVVVGCLDGHLDVVRVALLETRGGDPDELAALV